MGKQLYIDRNNRNLTLIQPIIITFIWVLLLLVPILFGDFPQESNWQHIFTIWKDYIFLFILFLVNRFVLLPYLFFKGHRTIYFILALVLILLLFSGAFLSYQKRIKEQPRQPALIERPLPLKPGYPDYRVPRHQPPPSRRELIPPYANILILSLLLLGFDSGLSISVKWLQEEQKRMKLEKENVENKLAFLRTQVSPHFFMNTLNNIHALIDTNTSEAQDSILKLSHLMRHLLYDSQMEKILFAKELEFIRNYVQLMKLRFTEKVQINLRMPDEVPEINIPPLLFTSIVENTFKHGISYEKPSVIDIIFDYRDAKITLETRNPNIGNHNNEAQGIGLVNTRKRLELLYGQYYSLVIKDTKEEFTVKLTIPV